MVPLSNGEVVYVDWDKFSSTEAIENTEWQEFKARVATVEASEKRSQHESLTKQQIASLFIREILSGRETGSKPKTIPEEDSKFATFRDELLCEDNASFTRALGYHVESVKRGKAEDGASEHSDDSSEIMSNGLFREESVNIKRFDTVRDALCDECSTDFDLSKATRDLITQITTIPDCKHDTCDDFIVPNMPEMSDLLKRFAKERNLDLEDEVVGEGRKEDEKEIVFTLRGDTAKRGFCERLQEYVTQKRVNLTDLIDQVKNHLNLHKFEDRDKKKKIGKFYFDKESEDIFVQNKEGKLEKLPWCKREGALKAMLATLNTEREANTPAYVIELAFIKANGMDRKFHLSKKDFEQEGLSETIDAETIKLMALRPEKDQNPAVLYYPEFVGLTIDFERVDQEYLEKFFKHAFYADFRKCTIKNLDLSGMTPEMKKTIDTMVFHNCTFKDVTLPAPEDFRFKWSSITAASGIEEKNLEPKPTIKPRETSKLDQSAERQRSQERLRPSPSTIPTSATQLAMARCGIAAAAA